MYGITFFFRPPVSENKKPKSVNFSVAVEAFVVGFN